MLLVIECTYCGFKWEKNVYMRGSLDSECCPKCKDRNLKIKDKEDCTIDTYKGCPPFKKEEEDDNMGIIHNYITLDSLDHS